MEKELDLKEMNFCQSCGMPMHNDSQLHGTNADSSKNSDYCCYCLENGKYTMDVSMDEMINFVVPDTAVALKISEDEARSKMNEFFVTLKRWSK